MPFWENDPLTRSVSEQIVPCAFFLLQFFFSFASLIVRNVLFFLNL
jgi:hypothetical protein